MTPGTSLTDPGAVIDRLCDLDRRVVFFPVRHHSPACAALVAELIEQARLDAVLIEGPSDYAPYLEELYLDHELPIAIYSYVRDAVGNHRGAYYPFCEYSPEWSALRAARRCGAEVSFIDAPWGDLADVERVAHRYADAELRRGRYVRALCDKLGLENFDDLWDALVESRDELDLAEYLRVAHSLCCHVRWWEDAVSEADCRREAFMADCIRSALDRLPGRLLVVTGGFHSSALVARLDGCDCPGVEATGGWPSQAVQLNDDETCSENPPVGRPARPSEEEGGLAGRPTGGPSADDNSDGTLRGVALIAYSYERLDSLTGYEAGMPNPGFYEHAWRQRSAGQGFDHRPLLAQLADELRSRKQTVSTADLIAVDTSAHALAALRGRKHVWRRDLIDAVTSSLVKDELEYGCESPLVDAVHAILRGTRRGRLAAGTRSPPLVADIQRQLAALDLQLARGVRDVELDLLEPFDRERGRLLHRLRTLGIAGYKRTGGTDFIAGNDLSRLWESWRLAWSPEFESTAIEAARYGTTLLDAVRARLVEQADLHDRSARQAAELVLAAAQAGIETLGDELLERLQATVAQEPEFQSAAAALGHLLFLYCHDEAFGTANLPRIGQIVGETFLRALWLLESLGQTSGDCMALVDSMRTLAETFERGARLIGIDRDDFTAVLTRVQSDGGKPPLVRGAAAGILWNIGQASAEQVLADLRLFASAEHLGDFLTGLFALARETVQRHPRLVQSIDQLLLEFGGEEFQQALPSLRLAFTYFTPREKDYMLETLFESLGLRDVRPLARLTVDAQTAAAALAFEERVFAAVARYGLAPDQDENNDDRS